MAKITSIKKAQPVKVSQTGNLTLNQVKTKFARLKAIQTELVKVKALYQEHDLLMEELLPLFIEIHPDRFEVKREFTLGNQKFRLEPHFFDAKKGTLLAKNWKSSAYPTVSIE